MTTSTRCRHCHGTGRVTIAMPYQITLKLVPGVWTTTCDIHKTHKHKHSVRLTALINRLNALVGFGLVEKTGRHRGIHWRRI